MTSIIWKIGITNLLQRLSFDPKDFVFTKEMRPPVKVNQTFYSLSRLNIAPDNYKMGNIGFESERGLGISYPDAAVSSY